MIGAMAISRDVTASRRAVALFERSFHEATIGELILRDGRIERANEGFAAMVGHTVEALVGSDPVALVHPDEQAEAREAIRGSLAGNGPSRATAGSWRRTARPSSSACASRS